MAKAERTETTTPFFARIEFGKPQDYPLYIPREEIVSDFNRLGIPESQVVVEGIYLDFENGRAVGVFPISAALCEGHFEGQPLLRGVDQLKAMAQTEALFKIYSGDAEESGVQREVVNFGDIKNVLFQRPMIPVKDQMPLSVEMKRLGDGSSAVRIQYGTYPVARGIVTTDLLTPIIVASDTSIDRLNLKDWESKDADSMLDEFRYGASKKFVDELYLNGSTALGILEVNRQRCKDGDSIPQEDLVEAFAQTLLLAQKARGVIPDGESPRFVGIQNMEFSEMRAGLGSKIHIVARPNDSMSGMGKLYCGRNFLGSGTIEGVTVENAKAKRTLELVTRRLFGITPSFVLKQ